MRWTILLVGMFFFTYWGKLLRQGQALNYVVIPVFSCPFNLDQITEVPCYYLSHLPSLFSRFGETLPTRNLLYASTFLTPLLLSVALFGRVLCGFLCPAGLLQDVMDRLCALLHIRPISVTVRMNKGFRVLKVFTTAGVFPLYHSCTCSANGWKH